MSIFRLLILLCLVPLTGCQTPSGIPAEAPTAITTPPSPIASTDRGRTQGSPLQRPGEAEAFFPLHSVDASSLRITVEDAVMMALHNNKSLHVQQYNPIIAGTFAEIERSAFDPLFFGSLSYSENRFQQLSAATRESFSIESERLGGGVGVSQYLPTGTEIGIGLSQTRSLSDRTPEQVSARAELSLTQALLRGAKPSANLANLRRARLTAQISEFELRGFAEALISEVEIAYWRYILAHSELQIFQDSLHLAEQQQEATEHRIEVGQLAESERASADAEVALRRQALINAESTRKRLHLLLVRLLNPGGETFMRMPEIEALDDPATERVPLEEVEDHVALGRFMRPEINETHLLIEQNELEVVRTRNGLLPRLDLFVTLGKSGFADSFSSSVRDIDGESYDATVGLRFEHAFGRRESRALARRARAGRDQGEESLRNLTQLVEFDVRSAYIEAERARDQIEASAATRRLQEEALRGESEKFDVGLSTVLLVSQAQRDLLASRIAEVGALIDYRIALITLYRMEGSLLYRRGIDGPGA